jgi:hypothetical protein
VLLRDLHIHGGDGWLDLGLLGLDGIEKRYLEIENYGA